LNPQETHLRVLQLLDAEPHLTQRQLASRLGISLGKANYCIRALLEKGWIKAGNFANSPHKRSYLYKLTQQGISEKLTATRHFLLRKEAEYEQLAQEIERLHRELATETPAQPNKPNT